MWSILVPVDETKIEKLLLSAERLLAEQFNSAMLAGLSLFA